MQLTEIQTMFVDIKTKIQEAFDSVQTKKAEYTEKLEKSSGDL